MTATTVAWLDPSTIYEFEVPHSLAGLLIGKEGSALKTLRFHSGAIVYLRDYEKKRDTHQICVVRGSRNEINKCMNLLRMRLPYERFPDLNLFPVNSDMEMSAFSMYTQEFAQLTKVELPENEFFDARVTNVMQNGTIFIVQPTTISYLAQAKMQELLERVYNSLMTIPGFDIDQLEIGLLCVVCADSLWVRASICQILEETDEVIVMFVDYGGEASFPRTSLRMPCKELLALPMQAVQCGIANVRPIDDNMGYGSQAIEYLRELVILKDVLVIKMGTHADLVDMWIVIDEIEYSINQCLVDAGHAVVVELEEESLLSLEEETMKEWMEVFSDL